MHLSAGGVFYFLDLRKFTPIECTALESLGGAEARWKILKVLVGSRGLEEGYAEVGTNCPHFELVASWLAGCRTRRVSCAQRAGPEEGRSWGGGWRGSKFVPLMRKCVENAYP